MLLKTVVNSVMSSVGLEIRRKAKVTTATPAYQINHAMVEGLKRNFERSRTVNTIIDVGAAGGTWSMSAADLWRNSNFLLFEPLSERKRELEELTKSRQNFHFINAAAGEIVGSVEFHVSGDLDGSGVADTTGDTAMNARSVPVTTIDHVINELHLPGPYLLKLDTHGFEIPILKGCREVLGQTALIIIECYGFHIARNSLLFWEMCAFMDKLNFRLVDIVDIMHRPKDQAFWQCDAFFVPKDLKIFADNTYSG